MPLVERSVDGIGGRHREQRIAVGRSTHHHLGGDVAVGARPVVDDEILPEPFRQSLCGEPRENVGRDAGRIADEDAYRPCRISVGAGDARQHRQCRRASQETQKFPALGFHCGFNPANLTTLPHLSVSSTMNLPNCSGDMANSGAPNSESRSLNFGSAWMAPIAAASLSIMSFGVFFGAT